MILDTNFLKFFRNANSLWKLGQLKQIEKHLKAKV